MLRWLFVGLLGVQAHFAASYLVPLDEEAQQTFLGLLRWVWPWSIGDSGPLGRITPAGFPISGFFLAVTTAGFLILAALSVANVWVPPDWWRVLAIIGAALSIVLMALFLGLTKLLPIMGALVILAAALGDWAPVRPV